MKRIVLTSLLVASNMMAAFCQDTIRVGQPFVTYSSAQQRQQLLLKRLSDYTYIIGRDFGKFAVLNADGDTILDNNSFVGKIVLVNFWFDGCAYCHNLFQPLNKLFEHYKDNPGVKIVSFTFDDTESIQKNINRYKLFYPVFHLSETLCHSLIIDKGFPANFLLNKNGKIVEAFGVTPLLDNRNFFEEVIVAKIDSLLN